jgi:type II secretory pathway pseudopilin PulG
MKKNQRGFSVIELIIIILVVAIIGTVGYLVWRDHKADKVLTGSTTSRSSSQSASSSDVKTGQDLASISKALIKYYYVPSNYPGLAGSLSQLKIGKLNYSLSNFSYKASGGGGGIQYQLCANFQTDTFTVSGYGKLSFSDGGQSATDYGIHGQGQQCFENDLAPDTDPNGNFSIVFSSEETNLMNMACPNPSDLNPSSLCEGYYTGADAGSN